MTSPIDSMLSKSLTDGLFKIEKYLNADVIVYYGEIPDSIDAQMKVLIEELHSDLEPEKHNKCFIILTTPGGSIYPVDRMVTILRHFYDEVNFIIPNCAYSAGTIFCMSGDNIYMNYYSALGPIDPQVQNKDGKLVAAIGYLDKVNELLEKAQNNTISQAEFLILKDFDLAELRAYEQAKALAEDLIVKWLSKYKFKDWTCHSNGDIVTQEEKDKRALEIAQMLSNNNVWKSHGRAITINDLRDMQLKIEDYGENDEMRSLIDDYYGILKDYIAKYGIPVFIQTRRSI